MLGIAFIIGVPRIQDVHPRMDDGDVPSFSPLRITFSRKMKVESVALHLETLPQRDGEFIQSGNAMLFYPQTPWAHGEVVTVTIKAGAQSTLGLPLLQTMTWKFSVAEMRVAYLWPFGGVSNLYALEPSKGKITRLTESQFGLIDFDVTQNGMTIFYSAYNDEGGSDIFKLDLEDGSINELMACGTDHCQQPLGSPDGRYLAFRREGVLSDGKLSSSVWLMPLPGGNAWMVSESDEFVDDIVWNPQGLLGYHLRSGIVMLLDPDTDDVRSIEIDSESLGVWSPDGKWYLTTSLIPTKTKDVEAAISSHLILYNMETGETKDLTEKMNLEDATPVFSPDGEWIAFGRKVLDMPDWTPGRQLWLMKVDGSGAHALTNRPDMHHVEMQWSPDGEKIVFLRSNQGNITAPPEIWMMNRDGSNQVRLVINAFSPRWIP